MKKVLMTILMLFSLTSMAHADLLINPEIQTIRLSDKGDLYVNELVVFSVASGGFFEEAINYLGLAYANAKSMNKNIKVKFNYRRVTNPFTVELIDKDEKKVKGYSEIESDLKSCQRDVIKFATNMINSNRGFDNTEHVMTNVVNEAVTKKTKAQ